MTLRCNGCGRTWETLADLRDVRQLGLALVATCPACGQRLAGVNALWQRSGEAPEPPGTQEGKAPTNG
jgi:hypothetical protein